MGKAKAFCHCIDIVNEWAAKLISLLIIPIVLVTTIEVILRYVFNMPSIWAWDVNIHLMAVIIFIGAGYTLLYRGHIIVDVVVGRFSPRVRAIMDLVTSGFFFLGIGVLLWRAILKAAISIEIKEQLISVWGPPLYPLRVVIAVGILLLLLQGIVKFIRALVIAWSGTEGVNEP